MKSDSGNWLLTSMTKAVMHECSVSLTNTRLSLPSIALAVCIVVGCEQSDQYNLLPYTDTRTYTRNYSSLSCLWCWWLYSITMAVRIRRLAVYRLRLSPTSSMSSQLRGRYSRSSIRYFLCRLQRFGALTHCLASRRPPSAFSCRP